MSDEETPLDRQSETFSSHGWTMRVVRCGDVWRWNVRLGSIRFGDLMLACQEGYPGQAYPTIGAARNAAIAWAAEHER